MAKKDLLVRDCISPEGMYTLGAYGAEFGKLTLEQFVEAHTAHRQLPAYTKAGAGAEDAGGVKAKGAAFAAAADMMGLPTDPSTNLFTVPDEDWVPRKDLEAAE